jgi:hypothetical protein
VPDRPKINEDFSDILLCLQRASVEFVLAGGGRRRAPVRELRRNASISFSIGSRRTAVLVGEALDVLAAVATEIDDVAAAEEH